MNGRCKTGMTESGASVFRIGFELEQFNGEYYDHKNKERNIGDEFT